jgi:CRP-like cAMP-binding protein
MTTAAPFEAWGSLLDSSASERVRPGTELLSQGFRAESVVAMASGLVKLLRGYEDGRHAIVGLRKGPCLIGVAGALLGAPQLLSAVAITEGEVSRVKSATFLRLIKEDRELSWFVHLEQARELQQEAEHAAKLACLSARERLRSFLAFLETEFARHDGTDPVLPLRDWEIAELLGITRQYLSRFMREAEHEGLLKRRGKRWTFAGTRTLERVEQWSTS